MKKILKRVTAMCCAIVMVTSISANARTVTDEKNSNLGSCSVQAKSVCNEYSAYGSTSTSLSSSNSVNSNYVYINMTSFKTGESNKSTSVSSYSNTVNFSAPSGCKSVQISSSHYAAYNGDSVNLKTKAVW